MNRVIGLDLIRIIAILGVVIYHFNANFDPIPFAGDWGSFGVILFFMLSGYLLRVSFSKNSSLKNYYTKRFLSIFPLLWVTFIIFYIIHSIRASSFFYGGSPYKLLYSFAGFDGYLYVLTQETNYFIIGEWFTGAILILYLIFPFLNKLLDKNIILSSFLIGFLYFISVHYDTSNFNPDAKFFVTVGTFWTGMVLEWINERFNLKYYWLIPLTFLFVLIYSHHDWVLYVPGRLVMMATLFLIILIATKDIHLNPKIAKVIAFVSDVTFSVYLVHHMIIYYILDQFQAIKNNPEMFYPLMIYTLLVIFVIACLLYWLSNWFVRLFSYSINNAKKS